MIARIMDAAMMRRANLQALAREAGTSAPSRPHLPLQSTGLIRQRIRTTPDGKGEIGS
jgi:hypothetical protein